MRISIFTGIVALMIMLLVLPGAVSAGNSVDISGSIVKPDLVVTTIAPNVGTGAFMFANEPNVISVTVKNQGNGAAGASTLLVDVAGTPYTVSVGTLAASTSVTVTITDTLSRTGGASVTITATADSASVIDEGNEANNVLTSAQTVYNNGYKGKRWTGGSDINTQAGPFDGRYGVRYSAGNSAYNSALWTTKTYSWSAADLPIPSGATVTSARLYQSYNYNKMATAPAYTMSFNGNTVTPAATYTDRKGFGTYDYPYGLYVFDVTSLFNPAGNSITITPEAGNDYSINGAYLIVVYQDAGTTVKKIWINDEYDNVWSRSTYSTNNDEATAYANFAGVDSSGVANAQAIAILASAGDASKSKFFFNSNEYTGFWSNYLGTPQIGFSPYDVTAALTSGANTAKLQSYDTAGNGDNMYVMNTILIVEKSEGSVSADFTPATPVSGDKPYTVAFTDASTGHILSRLWDFGDGTTSTDVSPSHTYTTRGTFTVKLTVNGIGSISDTETKNALVTVKEPAPVAGFSGTPLSGNAPLTVAFTDASTGVITSRLWDFGDGTTSTDVSPSHTYTTIGSKTVKLTVTGPDYSDDEIKTNYVSVGEPVIDISVTPAGINFGTMTAGADSTGSTAVTVTTNGGTAWTINAAANNGGYMMTGATPLASPFQLANGAGSFHVMTSNFASFMTGTPDEDKTATANVKQAIAAADAPGAYAITLTFTGGFS